MLCFVVIFVFREVSYHCIGTDLVAFKFHATDWAKLFKLCTSFGLVPSIRQIFSVYVILTAPNFTFARLVFSDSDIFRVFIRSNTSSGWCWFLEANKAISARGVVRVERYLGWFDFTILFQRIFKPSGIMLVIFGNSVNENISFNKWFLFLSFYIFVEWQSTAFLTINFKVEKGLAGLLETLRVWDGDNCVVKWYVQIASNYGLTIKFITSFFHKEGSDLFGRGFLSQVVQEKSVISLNLTFIHFFILIKHLYSGDFHFLVIVA